MNELQSISNGSQTMSSVEIAEVTGKQHKHVMRDIKKLEPAYIEAFGIGNGFKVVNYTDSNERSRPMYTLTKSQALFIVSGYKPTLRAKIQARFEELEELVAKPKVLTRKELLTIAMEMEEELEAKALQLNEASATIKENEPKVEAFNALMSSKDNVSFGEFSKAAGIGRNTLYERCREKGILIKSGDSRNLPKQYQINQGRFVVQESTYRHGDLEKLSFKTLITPKGQIFLIKKMNL